MIDRDHPPCDESYGWRKPSLWEDWVDLAEQLPLDQLAEKIAVFEADLSRIEYGSSSGTATPNPSSGKPPPQTSSPKSKSQTEH